MAIPMLPFPSPNFCAAAFKLCSCNRLVALEFVPSTAEDVMVSAATIVSTADGEGRANVAEVEVDVVGAAEMLEGATGEVLIDGGALLEEEEGLLPVMDVTLDTLLVEPCRPFCRGL
jgi:hypothetical protein